MKYFVVAAVCIVVGLVAGAAIAARATADGTPSERVPAHKGGTHA
jgi:hypothetical protein